MWCNIEAQYAFLWKEIHLTVLGLFLNTSASNFFSSSKQHIEFSFSPQNKGFLIPVSSGNSIDDQKEGDVCALAQRTECEVHSPSYLFELSLQSVPIWGKEAKKILDVWACCRVWLLLWMRLCNGYIKHFRPLLMSDYEIAYRLLLLQKKRNKCHEARYFIKPLNKIIHNSIICMYILSMVRRDAHIMT